MEYPESDDPEYQSFTQLAEYPDFLLISVHPMPGRLKSEYNLYFNAEKFGD